MMRLGALALWAAAPWRAGALQAGAGSAMIGAVEVAEDSHALLERRGVKGHAERGARVAQGPADLDMYGMPRNFFGISVATGTPRSARIFAALSVAYLCACLWYDWSVPQEDAGKDDAIKKEEVRQRRPSQSVLSGHAAAAAQATLAQRPAAAETTPLATPGGSGAGSPQQRLSEWDFTKLVLLFFVVYYHQTMFATPLVWLSWGWTGAVPLHFATVWFMSGFVFVSGVFGQSTSRSALSRVFCYTVGTTLLLTIFRGVLTLVAPGPADFGFTALTWYLVCLFVWRFAVTPAFVFARARGLPGPLCVALLTVGAYLLHHMEPSGVVGGYWQYVVVFAPFFGLGLLRTPAEWTALLAEKAFIASSAAWLSAWYGCLALWPWFREQKAIAEVACWTGYDSACSNVYFPNIFTPDEMGFGSFGRDLRAYVLKSILTVAVMSVLCALFRLLRSAAPRLAAGLADCGDRTLYGYLLHMLLFLIVGMRMGLWHFLLPIPAIGPELLPDPGNGMPRMPADAALPNLGVDTAQASWPVACSLFLLLAVAVLYSWTSRLTERIFRPLVYPYWLLSCVPVGPVS